MEKELYEVNLGNIVCRRAKATDNIDEIVELIYQTDPYLYPYWFENDIERAKEFLREKILTKGFIFNYENLYIAYDKVKNKIVGLIVAIDPTVDLNYDYTKYINENERNKYIIERYIYDCIHEAKIADGMYIMNCAVLEEYRGQGIGKKLLGHFIGNMEKAGFNSFKLDCLLHNLRAKNLYHSLGFKEMEETQGFTWEMPVELVVFVRHKGEYLQEEFQKQENYKGVDENTNEYVEEYIESMGRNR